MTMSTILVKSFQVTALASALALVGCGSGGNDTLPPKSNGNTNTNTNGNASTQKVDVSSITITKSFDKFSLAQDAKFSITANAINNGRGVAGAIIDFTLPNPSETGIYTVSAIPATTNESGEAVIELQVKDIAKAKKYLAEYPNGLNIQASPTNASSSVNAGTINLTGQQPSTSTNSTLADVNKVSIITDTNTLTGEAGQTVKITAQIRDKDNNALANLPVTFSIDDTNATGVIAKSALTNVMTNDNGEAVLELETSALSAEQLYYLQTSGLTVKASSGTDNSVFKEIKIKTQEVAPASRAESLLLSAEFNQIKAEAGNKVKITATVIDKNGAIVANAPVSLSGLAGTGLINNTGAVVNTDETGQAVFELEIKDVAKATTALANPVTLTAQSGATAVGTTTLRGAASNADTEAYKLFVSPSKTTLRTTADTATLGIKVTDTNGGIKAGVPVQLQIIEGIDKGITFSKASNLVTDANGFAEIDLVQSDIGLVSKLDHTAKIKVVINDGVYKQTEQTLDFTITGTNIKDTLISKSIITDSTSDTVTVSGVAVDGNDTAIANQSIQLLKDGTALTVPTVNTDANGKFTFTVNSQQLGAATDSTFNLQARITNGTVNSQPFNLGSLTKVTATNLSLTVTQNGQPAVNNEVKVDTPTTITVDLPSTVADGTLIYLTTNKGTLSNGQTRVSVTAQGGKAVFENVKSTSPGVATLNVEYNGTKQLEQDITYITDKVAKLLAQVTSTTVSVNGETKVIATVRDANDAPVKNALVEFSTVQDASGGKLSSGTALTDASGNAVVSYFAGSNAAPVNGVQIRTAVNSVKLGNTYLPVTGVAPQTISFTVQNFSAWIGFAFADKVASNTNDIYYVRNGSIFINNSIGQPAANQDVSISIVPKTYGVGLWKFVAKVPGVAAVAEVKDENGVVTTPAQPAIPEVPAKWTTQSFIDGSTINGIFNCLSEDFNGNATLDSGEDYNDDKLLTPLNPITVLAANGTQLLSTQTVKTDATGKVDFSIRYGKEYAQWMTATVRVTTKVDGNQFSQERDITLPLLDDDLITEDNKGIRPNEISPFGTLKTANMGPYCSFVASDN